MELHIEKELAVKISPLTKEEFDPLEGNIGQTGCQDTRNTSIRYGRCITAKASKLLSLSYSEGGVLWT